MKTFDAYDLVSMIDGIKDAVAENRWVQTTSDKLRPGDLFKIRNCSDIWFYIYGGPTRDCMVCSLDGFCNRLPSNIVTVWILNVKK